LVFQMAFSSVVSFLYTTGSSLLAIIVANALGKDFVIQGTPIHVPSYAVWPAAIGLGLVSSAVSLTYYFRASELTKGMTAVLPAGEAGTEINTDTQVIHKPDK